MIDKLTYLSDDHHYALAAVATRSSQMEHMIDLAFVVALPGQKNLAEYALKNLGADRIVGALEAALVDRALPIEDPRLIANTISRIKSARNSRNEMLHWIYGAADDPKLAKLAIMRPFRETREKHLTAEQFQAVADEMLSICTALHVIMMHCARQDELRRMPLPQIPWPNSVSTGPKGLGEMFAPPHPLPSSPDSSSDD